MSNNPSILTLQAGDQGAFSQLVNRRLLEIKQRCGTPDERAGTPDQPT